MTFKMLMKYYIQHEQWIRIRLQTPIIHHIKPEISYKNTCKFVNKKNTI